MCFCINLQENALSQGKITASIQNFEDCFNFLCIFMKYMLQFLQVLAMKTLVLFTKTVPRETMRYHRSSTWMDGTA